LIWISHRILKSSITVEPAAVNNPKNIHYKVVESFIIKKCPGCKYSKTRDSESSILKPMYSIDIQSIFIKIRITQLLFLLIIKIFFLKGEFVLNERFIFFFKTLMY